MGCCFSSPSDEDRQAQLPMSGSTTVGRVGGQEVNRDEQRARAAAAAEARSKAQQTRGQQGATSKMKPSVSGVGGERPGPEPLIWD